MGLLSIFDTILFGIRRVYYGLIADAVEMPERPALNFEGEGVKVIDDPGTNRTRIVISPAVGSVPESRTITGDDGIEVTPLPGTLDADLTVKLVSVNDTQHGARAGGTLHALAVAGTPGTSGFISGASQLKLDSMPPAAEVATQTYVNDQISAAIGTTAATLEDTDTPVNANGVGIQALTGTLQFIGYTANPVEFKYRDAQATAVGRAMAWGRIVSDASGHATNGTGAYQSVLLPDASGTEREAGRWQVELTNHIGEVFKQTFSNWENGLTPWLTVTGTTVKLDGYASGVAHFLSGGTIASSLIVDADVSVTAGIQCIKTDGAFGGVAVSTDNQFGTESPGLPLLLKCADMVTDDPAGYILIDAAAPYVSATGGNCQPGGVEVRLHHHAAGAVYPGYFVITHEGDIVFQFAVVDETSCAMLLGGNDPVLGTVSSNLRVTAAADADIIFVTEAIGPGEAGTETGRLKGDLSGAIFAAQDSVQGKMFCSPSDDTGDATAGTITLDMMKTENIEVGPLTGNATLQYVDIRVGVRYLIFVRQHASSPKTCSWEGAMGICFASGENTMGATAATWTVWGIEKLTSDARPVCWLYKPNIQIP